MHPEIEKLIDLAITDGQITEKEKEIILRKANTLGLDTNEIEMILEGKLHQLEASKPKQKEKVGNIKTCPACGASVNSLELNCLACGHEYVNKKSNSNLQDFLSKFENISKSANNDLKFGTAHIAQQNTIQAKSELIQNYPIPNNKEDLMEFLAYCISKGQDYSYNSYFGILAGNLSGSWRMKSKEIIDWSKTILRNDEEFKSFVKSKENQLSKIYRKRNLTIIITITLFCGLLILNGFLASFKK
jgi:hypothetical protein